MYGITPKLSGLPTIQVVEKRRILFIMKSGIYMIKCDITKRFRIGGATDIAKRFSNYKANLLNGKGNAKMVEDVVNYGLDKFSWIILEECSVEDLFIREAYYIELYCDCLENGYNSNRVIKKQKYIRNEEEFKKYNKKRSSVTSGENNGHNTKLSKENVFEILDMLKGGVSRDKIANKFHIYPAYTYRIGKDRWVKEYKQWKEKGIETFDNVTIPINTVNTNAGNISINVTI